MEVSIVLLAPLKNLSLVDVSLYLVLVEVQVVEAEVEELQAQKNSP
jgi:hypothetical protein